MNKKTLPLDLFTSKCRENNLKITPQRIAIYQELIKDCSHPSTDDVYKKIRKKFPNISFDTVNRTLLSFAQIGIIKFAEHFGRQKRFDTDIELHHHLSCIKCHRIIDFANDEYDNLKIPSSIKNRYIILGKKVVLEVICDKCKSK
ncbi:Fur family transcriptional regulator [Candidatus Omnitrophota bacterium]